MRIRGTHLVGLTLVSLSVPLSASAPPPSTTMTTMGRRVLGRTVRGRVSTGSGTRAATAFVPVSSSLSFPRSIPSSFDLRSGTVPHGRSLRRFHTTRSTKLPVAKFHDGDEVTFESTGTGSRTTGVVRERNGGWYTVLDSTGAVVKKRAGSLQKRTTPSSSTPPPPPPPPPLSQPIPESIDRTLSPPTITDLDSLLLHSLSDPITNPLDAALLRQARRFSSVKTWITFTDLHCQSSTLDTCLTVLRTVHRHALSRPGTGILFLGDFWHRRAVLRVDCLNGVLGELAGWRVPCVMIPGNHDQVTLDGVEHSLTPLKNAYSLPDDDGAAVPGIMVLDTPTVYLSALFVPHIRSTTTLRSILSSSHSHLADALFLHADVRGAYMNDSIVSTHGIPLGAFPKGGRGRRRRRVYTGHFHKPHTVEEGGKGGVSVRYVGSPYETTLAEAYQEKKLLVLDRTKKWECVEEIPLDVGRRHRRCSSVEGLLDLGKATDVGARVRKGDRVVVTLPRHRPDAPRRDGDGEAAEFDERVRVLRDGGVDVELRETSTLLDPAAVSSGVEEGEEVEVEVEDLDPRTTWERFLTEEEGRGAVDPGTRVFLEKAGAVLLEGLDGGTATSDEGEDGDRGRTEAGRTDLVLSSVTLRGYGPFRGSVTYPLGERGLVLLRGSSGDVGADSNGSGKTSLAMSTLWALTGSVDPRPSSTANVGSDIVNDSSKSATVSLTGTVDSRPFVLSRTRSSSNDKTSLTFLMEGVDLTRQSVKETQALVYETLGIADGGILSRTIFHGQHSMEGLLEATDSKLKEELSIVTPLEIWQRAAERARRGKRHGAKEESELDGMLSMREKDLEDATRRLKEVEEMVENREKVLEETEGKVKERIAGVEALASTTTRVSMVPDHFEGSLDEWFERLQRNVREAAETVQEHEARLASLVSNRNVELEPLEVELEKESGKLEGAKTDLRELRYRIDRDEFALESATERLNALKLKWNVDDDPSSSTDHGSVNYTLPKINLCPTCHRPLDEDDEDSHQHLQSEIDASLTEALDQIETYTHRLSLHEVERSSKKGEVTTLSARSKLLTDRIRRLEDAAEEETSALRDRLGRTRREHARISTELSSLARRTSSLAELETIRAGGEAEILRRSDDLASVKTTLDDARKAHSELETTVREFRRKRESARGSKATMGSLADKFGGRGVQTYVLKNTVHALRVASQSYLDELSDGTIRLGMELDSGDRILRKAEVLGEGGGWVERPLSSLSGGQWRRCSFAMSLGFSDLVARRGRLRSSILVLDEPLTHLDSVGRDDVGRLLRKILRCGMSPKAYDLEDQTGGYLGLGSLSVTTVLVILQDLVAEELSESFDCIDEVVKTGGHSELRLDGDEVGVPTRQ